MVPCRRYLSSFNKSEPRLILEIIYNTKNLVTYFFIIRIDGEKYEVESGREKKLLIQKRRILGENLMETILDALFYVILVTMNSYQL